MCKAEMAPNNPWDGMGWDGISALHSKAEQALDSTVKCRGAFQIKITPL